MLQRFFKVTVILLLLTLISVSANARAITDELVTNLSCSELSAGKIYQAIRPEAFESDRQISTQNYYKYFIGQCWGIARFQRLALLLGRADSTARYNKVLLKNLVTGVNSKEQAITSMSVFGWPIQTNLGQQVEMTDQIERFDFDLKGNSFNDLIEKSQRRMFYRLSNSSLIATDYTFKQQKAVLARIFTLIKDKKLPLISSRHSRMSQHIVIGKSVRKAAKGVWYVEVIDSNQVDPAILVEIRVQQKADRFSFTVLTKVKKTGEILQHKSADTLFLIDEYERPMIDKALVKHYTQLCK